MIYDPNKFIELMKSDEVDVIVWGARDTGRHKKSICMVGLMRMEII